MSDTVAVVCEGLADKRYSIIFTVFFVEVVMSLQYVEGWRGKHGDLASTRSKGLTIPPIPAFNLRLHGEDNHVSLFSRGGVRLLGLV